MFLQKELPHIEGFKGGDVFECAYAKLPEGCGETNHCDGCSIRKTVMDTFQTGKSHLKTPAYLFHGIPDNNDEIRFLISTEKVKDVVLLRIDEVGCNQEVSRHPSRSKHPCREHLSVTSIQHFHHPSASTPESHGSYVTVT